MSGPAEEAERLLAAAKLNPNDGGPFRSLGHHYARTLDGQRAARCYQRAVALDPDDAEAGEALCDLLDVEGHESLELAVCKEAAGKSPARFEPSGGWATCSWKIGCSKKKTAGRLVARKKKQLEDLQ